jgi:glycosyltransferase involved in cell wall biosynthesis
MKKIVWLSNIAFSEHKISSNGTWLQPMAEELIKNASDIQLCNITLSDNNSVIEETVRGIRQYLIPKDKTYNYGQTASRRTCKRVAATIDNIQPDIVHIWGTENIWASIYKQGYIPQKTLLDIQGLLFACAEYYYGGLTFKEIFQSIHLKEIIMPWRILVQKKKVFKRRGNIEIECLKAFKNISVQSDWVKNHVREVNPGAFLYPTMIMLRKNFYSGACWKYTPVTDAPVIFSSTSAAVSFKGLHVLIKAIAVLKKKYPGVQLRLAGTINVGNYMVDGYSVFLKKLIRKYDLANNITYLGSLNEDQIIDQLINCHVCVVPSFVESYCLAFAEAMILGVPVVASYAGAMPELGEHGKEVLFYNSLDHISCAANIERLLTDKDLAEYLSVNGRKRRLEENDINKVVKCQLSIYEKLSNNDQRSL